MSETTITRKAALEFAIANLDNAEVCTVLQKMLDSISKPRKATVSKARIANEALARKIAELLPSEGLGSKAITELGIPEVMSTQKAAAVMRVAEELNLVEKVKDGKSITYKPRA